MMKGMPAIPESTCSSITLRLLDHAARHWPQIKNLHVRCSRGFAYVTAALPGDNESRPLFRLRYGGSAHAFGFAYYSWAAGRYEDSVLITGSPVGTPQEALDTVATFHVSDTDDEPPTNLQTQPHSGAAPHPNSRASAWLRSREGLLELG
jgi:hypothetical protein